MSTYYASVIDYRTDYYNVITAFDDNYSAGNWWHEYLY